MEKRQRVLITGCGGMLGEGVHKVFSQEYDVKATDIDVNEPWLSYLDVRDYDSVRKAVDEFKPDFIFHLAALTDVEYCDQHPEEAYKTNFMGLENVASIAEELGCVFVYISTAGIFDGEKEKYDDFDEGNPLNHYGRSKYMGELYVTKNLHKYFVVRPGWMVGGGKKDKKFVAKIIKQIKEGKTELYAITNLYGLPTYTYDLAKTLSHLVKTKHYGVYNMVCKGDGNPSRYDIAVEIVKNLGLSDKISVKPVDKSFFDKDYFSPRPQSEVLHNRKLELRNMNHMRDWRECLSEYISEQWMHEI